MNRETIMRHAPTFIIGFALLVSAPRLAAAFAFVEPSFLGLPVEIITGPAFGLTATGAAVYVWQVYEDRGKGSRPPKFAKLLPIGWAILLALIAVALVPGMVLEVRASPLSESLPPPWDVAWCVALALASEIVVALTALAKSVAEPKKREEKKGGAEGTASKKPAKTYTAACSLCDWGKDDYKSERAARNAENAHQRKHKENREVITNGKIDRK